MASSRKMPSGLDAPAGGPVALMDGSAMVGKQLSYAKTDAIMRADRRVLRRKIICWLMGLVVLCFFSLCFMGAQGQYYPYAERAAITFDFLNEGGAYAIFTPAQVAYALWIHLYNAVGSLTQLYPPYPQSWLVENAPGYYAIPMKAQVLGITIISAVLLSLSGMLYQNVFKNPIAGPSMLGVGSGVSMGVMLLIFLKGAAGATMLKERYLYCYGFGTLILVFVILAGKRLSGKGKPYDIVTMLLVGSILSQLLGSIVSFVTLFVMDEESYLAYYTVSEMLTVDTSALSWIVLAIAAAASILPVYLLRFKMNALACREDEIRPFGVNPLFIRSVALICGAIMILAAQVHVGMVSLVTLVVPYLSRAWFGCEFRKQFIGNVCIGMVMLVLCRTVVDMIPFIGDGLALGSLVSVVFLPLFVVIMVRQARAWE